MKAIKYIFFLLLIAIIGLAIYTAVQPNEFNFSRSRVTKAPVSVVYDKVNDFKNWPEFSPWMEQEPDATLTYGDKTSGANSSYSWNGEVLGEGSMKTLSTEKNTSIAQHITFIKPFESESDINWFFENTSEGTKVTWNMKGKLDFMTKVYTTFAGSIEDMTGPDYERGLFKLDSVVTADMKKYSVIVNGITEHSGGFYIYNTVSCKIPDMPKHIQQMMPKLGDYAMKNNIKMAGAPFNYYHKWDTENNTVMFSCCVPTTERVISTAPDILTGQLKSFKALKTTLKGDYVNLKEAWETTMKHIEDNDGLETNPNGPMLEAYRNDPMQHPNPADWITELYIALK